MKFYLVRVFNSQQQYCSHHVIALDDSENIDDNKHDNDRASPMTQADYFASPAFYRVASDLAIPQIAEMGKVP